MCIRDSKNYVCDKSVPTQAQAMPSCDFKTGQVILQQPIEREQMQKLLSTGRTDLLDKFVSMRTRRAFKAMLVWDATADKVNFEFAPSKFPPRKTAAAPLTRAAVAVKNIATSPGGTGATGTKGLKTVATTGKAAAKPAAKKTAGASGVDENLNAPGSDYVPLAFEHSTQLPQPGVKPGASVPNRFYMYGVVGRLAMLAASYELEATDPDAEVYE